MRKLRCLTWLFCVGLSIMAVWGGALAGQVEQKVEGILASSPSHPERLLIEVDYSTNAVGKGLTGLGLRLHFDSSQIHFSRLGDVLNRGFIAQSQPQKDERNFDGDPRTDSFVLIAWADLEGNWPGDSQAYLFSAEFDKAAGFSEDTVIRFTASSTSAGCRFLSSPLRIGKGANGGPGRGSRRPGRPPR